MAGGSIVTLLLSDSDVRAICDVGALAAYIEDALRKEAKGSRAQLPERMNLGHGSVFLRVMPAVLPETSARRPLSFMSTVDFLEVGSTNSARSRRAPNEPPLTLR